MSVCCRLSSLAIWTTVLDPVNVTALFTYGLNNVPYIGNATAYAQALLSTNQTAVGTSPAAAAGAPAAAPAGDPAVAGPGAAPQGMRILFIVNNSFGCCVT